MHSDWVVQAGITESALLVCPSLKQAAVLGMTAAEAYAFQETDGEVDIASGGWIMSGASKVPVGQPLCEGHIWLMGEQYWFSCQLKYNKN